MLLKYILHQMRAVLVADYTTFIISVCCISASSSTVIRTSYTALLTLSLTVKITKIKRHLADCINSYTVHYFNQYKLTESSYTTYTCIHPSAMKSLGKRLSTLTNAMTMLSLDLISNIIDHD